LKTHALSPYCHDVVPLSLYLSANHITFLFLILPVHYPTKTKVK
jgi:hypothetical protein